MPSGKSRSKEDTWKADELKKAIQGDKKDDKQRDDRKSKGESSSKHRSTEEDRHERKKREVENGGDDRDRRKKDDGGKSKESSRTKEREKERSKDKVKESGTDKERTREKDHDRERKDREKEKREGDRSRDKERGKENEKSRDRRDRSKDRPEKKHDKDRERDREKDKERDQHRDKRKQAEKGKEKEHTRERSRDRERDRGNERDTDRGRERGKEQSRDRSKDRERDKGRERDRGHERDKSRERRKDKDQGRDRSKDRERERRDKDKGRNREREGEKDRERRRDRSRDRKDKDGDTKENQDRRDRDRDRKDKDEDKERSKRRDKEKDRKDEFGVKDDKERKSRHESKQDSSEDKVRRQEKELTDALKKEEESLSKKQASSSAADEVGTETEKYEDDDFEDYDDEDFEDFDDDEEESTSEQDKSLDDKDKKGMAELLRAIDQENETVRTLSRERNRTKEEIQERQQLSENTAAPTRPLTGRGRINFVAAKKKQVNQKAAARTKQRGQELMHLIDLDVVYFDVFDLPPMKEYDLYIKNFGRSDSKQAYVQCNDDNVEREMQTEEIIQRTKWVQCPPEDLNGCGDVDDEDSSEIMASDVNLSRNNIDSLHLSKFLQKSTQVCLILLEENEADKSSVLVKERKDMKSSEGFIQIAALQPFLEGRTIEYVHFSPVQSHLLLTAHTPVVHGSTTASKVDQQFHNAGIICLWNVNEPQQPQKVLVCESVPRCCCFSPSKATLAFAGMEDGSIVSWDLRETSSLHRILKLDGCEWVLRSPTFSTAGVLTEDNHLSPVTAILPIVSSGDSSRASVVPGSVFADEMSGLSFQLATLEENAIVNIWVVVELDKTDLAGSESDYGLAPGGKIKLIRSASITLESPLKSLGMKGILGTLTMQFHTKDPNHFYVATDRGCVLHCVRYGSKSPPKAHKPNIDVLVDVNTIDISPWQLPFLLAGCADGSVHLYSLKHETPLVTWSEFSNGAPVISVQWSRSRPSVFFVLDTKSRIHIWDLLQSDTYPVTVEQFKEDRVTLLSLSNDYSALGVGLPGRHPEMVLAYANGSVEVHQISSQFSKASSDELDRLETFLDSLTCS